jgi:hypothetical protein
LCNFGVSRSLRFDSRALCLAQLAKGVLFEDA